MDGLGEQVEGFSENEKVIVYPWISEGLCPACRIGEENLCDKPRSLGIYSDGGYAEYALVPNYKYFVKMETIWIQIQVHLYRCWTYKVCCNKNAKLKPDDNVVIVGTEGS